MKNNKITTLILIIAITLPLIQGALQPRNYDALVKIVEDKQGNIIEEQFFDQQGNPELFVKYNKDGNIIKETEFVKGKRLSTIFHYKGKDLSKIIEYDGTIITIKRDKEKKIISETTQLGKEKEVITYDYTQEGELWAVGCRDSSSVSCKEFRYDGEGDVVEYTINDLSVIQKLDNEGRKIALEDKKDNHITYNWDDEKLKSVDFFGVSIIANICGFLSDFIFDNACNVIQDNHNTYTYDNQRNVKEKTDKKTGDVTTFKYDANNNVKEIISPKGTEKFDYNQKGQKISYTDLKGIKFVYKIPDDDASLISADQLEKTTGDKDQNGNIDFTDFIIAKTENADPQTLTIIAYQWVFG